jgi:hypothetical protein
VTALSGLLKEEAGDHIYLSPPVATNEAVSPRHKTALDAVAVNTGFGVTVIITESFELHLLSPVTVSIYLVVCGGLAVVLAELALLNPFEGCQVYDLPSLLAINSVWPPLQIVVFPLTLMDGNGKVVILIVSLVVHPSFVTATWYNPD